MDLRRKVVGPPPLIKPSNLLPLIEAKTCERHNK